MKMGLFGRIVDSLALAFTLASCHNSYNGYFV